MQKVLAHLDHHLDLTVVHMHKELVREAVAGQGGEGLADMQDSEKEGVHMMAEVEREVVGNVLQPAQVRLPAEREEGLLREQTHLGSGHSELLATQVKASQLFCRTDMLSLPLQQLADSQLFAVEPVFGLVGLESRGKFC
uniref:Uncharacterized protein n=1 Tax=Palpitomonas bilix TaxID=652834 RepID=A0A7S3G209_9EUKA|mmetsp:Transcript_19312/g.49542  ORF Transcript_19312/g.49542 Transcript_19312/m.49542 type:complete len:140 (+) Transcript_19312:275-694(+)